MTSRVPGEVIFAAVGTAAKQFRDQAVSAAEKRDAAISRLDEIEHAYDVVLERLAEVSLPSLDPAAINSADSGVRPRLFELASRRDRAENELTARRRRVGEEFERRQRAVDEAEEDANSTSDLYEKRRNDVTEYLQKDSDYQTMKLACEQSQARLLRDRSRLEEVEADVAEKLPDYESSRLFTYLRDRGFGTADYRHSGIRKALDKRVARLIGYASLRESYQFLTTVPQLMQEELARRESDFDASVEIMLDAVKQAEASFKLDDLQQELDRTRKITVRVQADRDRSAESLETIEEQLSALRSRENRFYLEAMNEMKRYLETVEDEVLARQAQRTETLVDDDAVSELRGLRAEVEQGSLIVEEESARSEVAANVADGLDFLIRRGRQSELTSERTFFPNDFDVEEPLRQFEKGVIDRNRLVDVFRDAAEKDPTWAERAYQRGADMANSQTTQILIGTAAKAAEPLIREALRRRMR